MNSILMKNPVLVKNIASALCGIVGSFLIARNYLTTDQASSLTNDVLNLIGSLMDLASISVIAYNSTTANQIKSTASLPQVLNVVTDAPTALKLNHPYVNQPG